MNIQVISARDGRRELINLTEPLSIVATDTLCRIQCGNGMEHWFKTDGTYDGWGISLGENANLSPSEANALYMAIESGRVFIGAGNAGSGTESRGQG